MYLPLHTACAHGVKLVIGMSVIIKHPGIHNGEPVFRNTNVPFKSLLNYLERGQTLDDFLDDFPNVTRQDAITALEEARSSLVAHLR
jgi:uncharacterized protein (DUF433 family)